MMKFYEFLLGALGVWRLTHLLTEEDGPNRQLARLRLRAVGQFWATLLECFYCLSLWIAIPFALLVGDSWRERIPLWPALSALAILLQRAVGAAAPGIEVWEDPPSWETNDELLRTAQSDHGGTARARVGSADRPTPPR